MNKYVDDAMLDGSGEGSFLRLMSRLSWLPLHSGKHGLDEALNEAMGLVGRYFGADCSVVYRLGADRLHLDLIHEWYSDLEYGAFDQVRELPLDLYPFLRGYLMRSESLSISDIDLLPAGAVTERALLSRRNIRSFAFVPLVADEQVFGFIGITAVRHFMQWDMGRLDLLRLSGNMIVSAILRDRSEKLLTEELEFISKFRDAESLDEVLDHGLQVALRISDLSSGGIYLAKPQEERMDLAVHQGLGSAPGEKGRHYRAGSLPYRLLTTSRALYSGLTELPITENRFFLNEKPETLAVIPIRFRERLLGCLVVASACSGGFPDYLRKQLESIALQLGMAICLVGNEHPSVTAEERTQASFRKTRRHQSCQ
ncbi:MAG: GAF domain-containing protein [Chlorobiaceae bacterium]|nr:GAF domain-containing protein [Chlorobiaceae bacterium]